MADAASGCMKIRDVMRTGPFTITDTESLGNAQRAMARSRIRHLPVMADGRLVGMLSERDVLAARASAGADEDWWAKRVRDAMRWPVHTAGPDDSITEVAGRMADARIGAMPVVERGKLLGIATVGDVLDAEVRSSMAPPPVSMATAVDAMTAWPYTVRPDTLLFDAVAVMSSRHIRHLPVLDGRSTIVGMLSEHDVRTAIGDPLMFLENRTTAPTALHVKDVMTRPAVTVPFDRPILEIARAFADHKLGAMPVTDKFGALLGILSYVDVLRVLAR